MKVKCLSTFTTFPCSRIASASILAAVNEGCGTGAGRAMRAPAAFDDAIPPIPGGDRAKGLALLASAPEAEDEAEEEEERGAASLGELQQDSIMEVISSMAYEERDGSSTRDACCFTCSNSSSVDLLKTRVPENR